MLEEFIIRLKAFMYSICGIPSIVLKIIASFFFEIQKWVVISAKVFYV